VYNIGRRCVDVCGCAAACTGLRSNTKAVLEVVERERESSGKVVVVVWSRAVVETRVDNS